jgi:hypothetical protein
MVAYADFGYVFANLNRVELPLIKKSIKNKLDFC